MGISVRPRRVLNHPDYSLCNQTITVYNAYKNGTETKYNATVINNGAFLDFNRQWQESKTGATAANSFLLVIPQGADGKTFKLPVEFDSLVDKTDCYTLRNNDKVLMGIGNEITSGAEWANLISSKVDGLVTISSYDPKRGLDGTIVHVEAGGK